MAFDLESYRALRSTVWHLTHRENLAKLRQSGELLPADLLFDMPSSRPRRGEVVGKLGVRVRNQDLLKEKSVELESGNFSEFVENLNRRVFFWSGRPSGPVRAGRKALAKYAATDVVLRIPFADIVGTRTPEFTSCNSGATRMQNGRPVRRGPSTFQAAETATFRPPQVIEVTFVGKVQLPRNTEVLESSSGKWVSLFAIAG